MYILSVTVINAHEFVFFQLKIQRLIYLQGTRYLKSTITYNKKNYLISLCYITEKLKKFKKIK